MGGTEAESGNFPWQVALRLRDGNGDVFCGGTIVSENVVITAAHCTADVSRHDFFVSAGHVSKGFRNGF